MRVGELAFVNNESRVKAAGQNLRNDLVKGDDLGFDLRVEDFQRKVRSCQGAGNGDFDPAQVIVRDRPKGDDHRAVALSDAAATAHQCVVVLHVGVSVKADGGDIVKSIVLSSAIERFNVAQGVGELVSGHADLVCGKSVEHEGIVGVGTVRDGDINCRIHNGCISMSGAHGYQGPFKGKDSKGKVKRLCSG